MPDNEELQDQDWPAIREAYAIATGELDATNFQRYQAAQWLGFTQTDEE